MGFYIYVYPNKNSDKESQDYLQDTLDIAFKFVERKFGIKRSKWKDVEEDKL